MKAIVKISIIALATASLTSCVADDKIKELSASYSGKILDVQTGGALQLEYNSSALLFGDNNFDPSQPEILYIFPDGSFNNSRMLPGNYEITARGPFVQIDTLRSYDIQGSCKFDLKALPNVRLTSKSADVTSAGKCKMSVDYEVNSAVKFGEFSILWGKKAFPGALTASTNPDDDSASSWQKKYTFSQESGTVSLTTGNLVSGQTYYVRIGARVSGSDYWNYSCQYQVTTNGVKQ